MPVIGDATIIVRAITDKVKGDITRSLKDLDKLGQKAGEQFGESFADGFGEQINKDLNDAVKDAFDDLADVATDAGRRSSEEFTRGFTDGVDTELSNKLGQALDDVDSSTRGERLGRDLNSGIMRGLGDKGREISDLISDGLNLGDAFNRAFDSASESAGDASRVAGDEFVRQFIDSISDRLNDAIGDALVGDGSAGDAGRDAARAFSSGFSDELDVSDKLSTLFNDSSESATSAGNDAARGFSDEFADQIDVDRVFRTLFDDVTSSAADAGRDVGREFTDSLGDQLDLSDVFTDAFNDSVDSASDVGRRFSDQFIDSFSEQLDLSDAFTDAFGSSSDAAGSAGRESSSEFVDNFTNGVDTELADALNRALGDTDSGSLGERIGRELNAGIMRGLGNKDEEIGDLLDRAGSASGDRFADAFGNQGDRIARSLEDALNDVDVSSVGDRISNQLADALIPNMAFIGAEMMDQLADALQRGGGGGGGGIFDSIVLDPQDALSDLSERVARDFERNLNDDLDDIDVDFDLDKRLNVSGRRGSVFDDINDDWIDFQARVGRESDGLSAKLSNLFGGDGGDGNRRFFSNFSRFSAEARAASKTFTTLYGIGQLIGPVIGVAVGGLSALITGAVELTSIIAQGIPAAVAVAGQGISALIQGFATAKIATIGFGKAFKEGLKAAQIGELKGLGSPEYVAANEKYLEILGQLAPEAQSFAKYLISLRKEGIKLRNAAGKGLFPGLERSVERLYKALFPSLLKVLEDTGEALGGVAEEISKAMSTERFVRNFNKVAKTNNEIITISGRVFGNLIDAVNSFLVAAGPVTIRFAEWIESLTASWRESVNTKKEIGELTDKLNGAGDILAQLGRVFGNIGRGLAALGRAAAPAGQRLLDAFEGATKKFEEFTKSLEDNPKAAKFFDDVATNVIAIGRLFNTLVLEFAKLGDNTAIAETAESLEPVVVSIGDILDKLTESGPALGEFLTTLTETFDLLTDSGAINAFIGTLDLILTKLNEIISSDFGQKFLLWFGPIFAVGRALSFTWNIARFFLLAFTGGFLNMDKVVGGVLKFLQRFILFSLVPAIQSLWAVMVANPVGAIVAAIVAVVVALGAFFTWLYKNNDAFKEWVDGVWQGIKDATSGIVDFFKDLWDGIKEGWEGLVDAVSPIVDRFKEIWSGVAEAIGTFVEIIKTAFTPLATFLIGYWSVVFNIFRGAVRIIWAVLQPLIGILVGWWSVLGTIFVEGAKTVWSIFKTMASFIWSIIKTLFGALRAIFTTLFVIIYTPVKIVIGLVIIAFRILKTIVTGIIKGVMFVIKTVWGTLNNVFGEPVRNALNTVKTVFGVINTTIRAIVGGIVTWIKPKLETIGKIFKTVFDAAKRVVKGAFDGIRTGIETGINKVKTFLNGFISITNGLIRGVNTVTGAINKLPGPDIPKIPEIPKLASGGVVYPTNGGTLAVLAEAGRPERVEPLDSSGLSAGDRAILEALKNTSGKEINVVVNNYYPEPERATENLAMSMRVAREHLAGV